MLHKLTNSADSAVLFIVGYSLMHVEVTVTVTQTLPNGDSHVPVYTSNFLSIVAVQPIQS